MSTQNPRADSSQSQRPQPPMSPLPTLLLVGDEWGQVGRRSWALRAMGFQVMVSPFSLRAAEQAFAQHLHRSDLDAALAYMRQPRGRGSVTLAALRDTLPALPLVVVMPFDDRPMVDGVLRLDPWVLFEAPVTIESVAATMLMAMSPPALRPQLAS